MRLFRITGAGRIGVPRPPKACSRVDTGRNPSAGPSNSNFPASHLGSQLGLIAQSYRAFSSPPLGPPTRLPGQANLPPPSPPAEKTADGQDQAGQSRSQGPGTATGTKTIYAGAQLAMQVDRVTQILFRVFHFLGDMAHWGGPAAPGACVSPGAAR